MWNEYATIQIRIFGKDSNTGTYPVETRLDDGDFYRGRLRIQQERLLLSQLDPEGYGLQLFDSLFHESIRDAYMKVTTRAALTFEGRVRVRLWISQDAAELHALPWERLYHIQKGQPVPLSTSTLTPFSRYAPMRDGEPHAISRAPIQLLYAIANPSDLESTLNLKPVDVEREVKTLHRALGDLRRNSRLQVTLMPGWTGLSSHLRAQLEQEGYRIRDGATSLDQLLKSVPSCHVFHFLGHGFFQRGGEGGAGTAALHLERGDGTRETVRDDELVTKLASVHPLPHLAFLAACQSATRDAQSEHPFVGLGPKLLRAGVPAVIAMQDVVPMELARQLTSDFYRNLMLHGQVDLALNQARLLLFDTKEVDWAIPVLFSRLVDNELVDLPPDAGLQGADDLATAAQQVLAAAGGQEQIQDLVASLEAMLVQWKQSREELVALESELRHAGEDPATFPPQFKSFYNDFKDYYNSETWVDEYALIREAKRLRDRELPRMRSQMDDETFTQVEQLLDQHVSARGLLASGFEDFLDTMDEAVVEIKGLVDSGDVAAAIQRKRDFQLEIAPSLRNSRKLLRQMSRQIMTVDDVVSRLETQEHEAEVVGSAELLDTVLVQSDRQRTLGTMSQSMMARHGVDERVVQAPGTSDAPGYARSQIDQMIAAERGMAARGILVTPETSYRLGMLAAYRRDYDVAVEYFRQAVEADPDYTQAFRAIAWLQQSRAMHDLHAREYNATLEKLAEAQAATSRIQPADEALVMQGYIAKTRAQVAQRRHNPGDVQRYLQEAARLFQQASEMNPRNAGAFNGLGNVAYMLGDLDTAITAMERATELHPGYAAAHHDLAGAYSAKMREAESKGDRRGAGEWCQKALDAFRRTYELAKHDPAFDEEDLERIQGYILQLEQRCGRRKG